MNNKINNNSKGLLEKYNKEEHVEVTWLLLIPV